jgi:transcriptional regulator GlxA family with amidase domain
LKDLQTDVQLQPYQRGAKRGHETQKKQAKAEQADKSAELLNVFDMVNVNGKVTVQDIAEFLGVERRTIERRLKKCDGLSLENGEIKRTK